MIVYSLILIIVAVLDVITDYPDKKSIMMYVMCYFQVLSKPETEINNLNNTSEVLYIFEFKFILVKFF